MQATRHKAGKSLERKRNNEARHHSAAPPIAAAHHEAVGPNSAPTIENAFKSGAQSKKRGAMPPAAAHHEAVGLEQRLVVCHAAPGGQVVGLADAVQQRALLGLEAQLPSAQHAVAPGHDDDATAGRAHARQLAHKLAAAGGEVFDGGGWLGRRVGAMEHTCWCRSRAVPIAKHMCSISMLSGWISQSDLYDNQCTPG